MGDTGAPEQHGPELCRSSDTWIFFLLKMYFFFSLFSKKKLIQ